VLITLGKPHDAITLLEAVLGTPHIVAL